MTPSLESNPLVSASKKLTSVRLDQACQVKSIKHPSTEELHSESSEFFTKTFHENDIWVYAENATSYGNLVLNIEKYDATAHPKRSTMLC